jgi:hypothetical protein
MYPKLDFFPYLKYIFELQINDLKSCEKLASFLVAVGCMNVIEFLGGIRSGELGKQGKVECRFKEGVRLLGSDNGVRCLDRLTKPVDEQTMWQLRNGLTHQYLPKVKLIATIIVSSGDTGTRNNVVGKIKRTNKHVGIKSPILSVNVIKLVRAIEQGQENLLKELRADSATKLRAEKVLFQLPELLYIASPTLSFIESTH